MEPLKALKMEDFMKKLTIIMSSVLAVALCFQGSTEPSSKRSTLASMLFWKSPVKVIEPTIVEGFVVREIDYKNQKEIDEVVDLCLNAQSFKNRQGKTDEQGRAQEKQKLLKDMKEKSYYKEFVCISVKNNQICGLLSCRYGYRRPQMVEYMNVTIHDKYKFEDVLFAMNQHAEKAFVALSMKRIANRVWSKHEFAFYLQHGFLVMDEDTVMKEHYIISDAFGMLFAAIFVIPAIVMACVDHGVVYKDIQ